jgi:hypothetical protein
MAGWNIPLGFELRFELNSESIFGAPGKRESERSIAWLAAGRDT